MSLDLVEAALDYAARGWPVFPLRPQGKEPLGPLVPNGVKGATTDADTIRGWWGVCPSANIAVATGVAFDVLDIDGPAEGQDSEVARCVQEHGDIALEGPTVETGSGYHLYVQPTGHGNRAKFLSDCDWRGPGGYVVAPPSVHPSGGRYAWLEDGPDTPLQPAPDWLVARLDPAPPARVIALEPKRMRDASAYARAAFANECAAVAAAPVGSRNQVLNVAAFSLGRYVGAGLLGVDDVTGALRDAALGAGLGQLEAERTIESGLMAGVREPRRPA